jgi:hypothetical protein
MKKTLFTLALGFLSTGLFAQDLVYTHDANGNRIVRETIVLKTANPNTSNAANSQPTAQQQEAGLETYLLGSKINIYPNPTQGSVQLVIEGLAPEHTATVVVLNANGQPMQQQPISTANTTLDLSGYAAGLYIVRLTLNGRYKEWRVVKQ